MKLKLSILFLTLFSITSYGQTVISRKPVTAPPSEYPVGGYLMDSETDSPYNWIYDAGVILGLKYNSSNGRHIQMIYSNKGFPLSIRARDLTNDSWTPWSRIVIEDFNGNTVVNGNLGIGIINPTHKLTVDGTISAKEVKVSSTPNSDYVFEPDYPLLPLSEVEAHIKERKHLPGIPSAEQFKENGVGLGEMDDMLLRKVEELTLYVLQQQKEIQELKNENEKLTDSKSKQVDELLLRIEKLEKR